MTIGELLEELRPFNPNAEIMICCDGEELEISDLDMSDDGIIHINS